MYAKISNNEVESFPYSKSQLKIDNPNTSFPSYISDAVALRYGVHLVNMDTIPDYNKNTHKVTMGTPVYQNDNWEAVWTVSALTSEELAAKDTEAAQDNRLKRNLLLEETDFYALSDVTMSDAMTTYRQALRDITTHSNWPHLEDGDWPTKP